MPKDFAENTGEADKEGTFGSRVLFLARTVVGAGHGETRDDGDASTIKTEETAGDQKQEQAEAAAASSSSASVATAEAESQQETSATQSKQ